jgi:SAM-dependent methyltransferase
VTEQIRFEDGAGYERYMGKWSRLVGDAFLEWLAPAPGQRWLDVGCGNGAFTQMIVDRCAPALVHGVDPSEAQLAYARSRFTSGVGVEFRQGDAMALPYPADSFDASVMPLVIFFVPQPERGIAEMARVVSSGGLVTAYAWDMPGGGFPYAPAQQVLARLGVSVPQPPHPEASGLDNLRALWDGAGLDAVELRAITVERTFTDFEEYWNTIHLAPSMGPKIKAMSGDVHARFEAAMRERLPPDAAGRITCSARAHAVKGRVEVR